MNRKRVCIKCGAPMRFVLYHEEVAPPVAYYICPRDCPYAEGVAQRSIGAIARRTLARLVARAGRRFLGW